MYSKLNKDVGYFSRKSYDEIKQSINLETLPTDEVNFQIYFAVRCNLLFGDQSFISYKMIKTLDQPSREFHLFQLLYKYTDLFFD